MVINATDAVDKAKVLFDPKYLKVDKFSFANSESQNSDELDVKSACLWNPKIAIIILTHRFKDL